MENPSSTNTQQHQVTLSTIIQNALCAIFAFIASGFTFILATASGNMAMLLLTVILLALVVGAICITFSSIREYVKKNNLIEK